MTLGARGIKTELSKSPPPWNPQILDDIEAEYQAIIDEIKNAPGDDGFDEAAFEEFLSTASEEEVLAHMNALIDEINAGINALSSDISSMWDDFTADMGQHVSVSEDGTITIHGDDESTEI